MILLFVMGMALVVAVAVSLWPAPGTGAGGAAEEEKAAPGPAPAATTLEGVLVAQLISGEINPGQYHTAVARLAARDDERNPLSAPGNGRPDACA